MLCSELWVTSPLPHPNAMIRWGGFCTPVLSFCSWHVWPNCKPNDYDSQPIHFIIAIVCTVFPRNLAAPRKSVTCYCRLVSINAALKIVLHDKGSTALYACASALYVHTHWSNVCTRVHVDLLLCRCCPRILAALELSPHQTGAWNKISPWRDFKQIQYNIVYPSLFIKYNYFVYSGWSKGCACFYPNICADSCW